MTARKNEDEETGILLGPRLLSRPTGYHVKNQLTLEEEPVHIESRLPDTADKPAKAEIRPIAESSAA